MSQLLSNERQHILRSALLGLVILLLQTIPMFIGSIMVDLLVLFAIGVTNVLIPILVSRHRTIRKKTGEYFNVEEENITKRMPTPYLSFVEVVIISFILGVTAQHYLTHLVKTYPNYTQLLYYLKELIGFVGLYIVVHIYLFYKNVPIFVFLPALWKLQENNEEGSMAQQEGEGILYHTSIFMTLLYVGVFVIILSIQGFLGYLI